MKKLPPNEKLIELARLAPKVEWKESAEPSKKKVREKQIQSNVLDFLDLVEVRGGKFEVRISDLFTIFESYDDTDMTYRQFRKELKKYVKFVKKDMFCKLNKKLITIEENFRNHDDSEEKDEEE